MQVVLPVNNVYCLLFSAKEKVTVRTMHVLAGTGQGRQVKSAAQVNHISNADNWPIYRAYSALCRQATLPHFTAARQRCLVPFLCCCYLCFSF